MKLILILFTFISSLVSLGQNDTIVRIEDFNSDGSLDTMIRYYEGGSGFGGFFIEIVNGKNGEKYKMETHSCFCEIRSTFIIPDALGKIESQPFLEAIKKELFYDFRTIPDPSLKWILSASINRRFITNDSLFSQVINPKMPWVEGEIELPKPYSIGLKGDLLTLYPPFDTELSPEELLTKFGVLVYWANNHYDERDSIRFVENNKLNYSIYITKHGIIAQKGNNSYKWIFISDINTTGAPNKLRWESINRIRQFGKYVFLEQSRAPYLEYTYFIINVETGLIGEFRADKTQMPLNIIDENNDYPFGEVFTAFKNMNQNKATVMRFIRSMLQLQSPHLN